MEVVAVAAATTIAVTVVVIDIPMKRRKNGGKGHQNRCLPFFFLHLRESHAEQYAQEEHVSRRLAQYRVQAFTAAYDADVAPCHQVEIEVNARCPDELQPGKPSAPYEPAA